MTPKNSLTFQAIWHCHWRIKRHHRHPHSTQAQSHQLPRNIRSTSGANQLQVARAEEKWQTVGDAATIDQSVCLWGASVQQG